MLGLSMVAIAAAAPLSTFNVQPYRVLGSCAGDAGFFSAGSLDGGGRASRTNGRCKADSDASTAR